MSDFSYMSSFSQINKTIEIFKIKLYSQALSWLRDKDRAQSYSLHVKNEGYIAFSTAYGYGVIQFSFYLTWTDASYGKYCKKSRWIRTIFRNRWDCSEQFYGLSDKKDNEVYRKHSAFSLQELGRWQQLRKNG